MAERAGWGIVGTGTIARTFAEAVQLSSTGRLAAVGSRDADRAEAFAREFAVEHAHGSYQALFEDASVEYVYVATPHPLHAESAIAAARARLELPEPIRSGILRIESVPAQVLRVRVEES